MSEETKNVQAPQLEVPDLPSILKGFPSAPETSAIEDWKRKHGEVFVSGFSETELFVWRPLDRATYVELQKRLRTQGSEFTELDFEQAVVEACVLWASDKSNLKNKGGSISTLSEQIMTSSNFVAPHIAVALVAKL